MLLRAPRPSPSGPVIGLLGVARHRRGFVGPTIILIFRCVSRCL
jgi:hypothetical protein